MQDDPIHVEHCATCGKLLNARNPQQSRRGADGFYRHATTYCDPKPESARERAERIWGGIATV